MSQNYVLCTVLFCFKKIYVNVNLSYSTCFILLSFEVCQPFGNPKIVVIKVNRACFAVWIVMLWPWGFFICENCTQLFLQVYVMGENGRKLHQITEEQCLLTLFAVVTRISGKLSHNCPHDISPPKECDFSSKIFFIRIYKLFWHNFLKIFANPEFCDIKKEVHVIKMSF